MLLLETMCHPLVTIYDSASVSTIDNAINSTRRISAVVINAYIVVSKQTSLVVYMSQTKAQCCD